MSAPPLIAAGLLVALFALPLASGADDRLDPGDTAGDTAGDCADASAVRAIDLVEPALLSSPLHTVRPCARIVGHMARFELDTRFGPLVADSIELLRLRVEELPAVEALERASLPASARAAASERARRAADAVARVTGSPLRTLGALPEGALRFLARRADDLGERARGVADRSGDALTGAGQAYDRASPRPGVAHAQPRPAPWWRRGGERVTSLARDWIGYGEARRDAARRLRVDPYTRNPLLAERLDALAWAAVAGEQAVGLALSRLDGLAADLLGAARRVDSLAWELPPEAIARGNDRRLAALGCGGIERRRFLRNGQFDPGLQTRLVDALATLAPRRGCIDTIELAAALEAELEARYLVAALELLAATAAPGGELLLVGAAPVLRSPAPDPTAHHAAARAGAPRLLLPLPVDRLEWTPETAAFFDQAAFRVVDKVVRIGGTATPNALRGLTRRGWEIIERQNAGRSMP